MPTLCCPVCALPLAQEGRALRCEKGHSFDLARQGYVNLLLSNRSSAKRHGDDRLMVEARSAFLEKGYYACLRQALCELALALCPEQVSLLDVGCGEGWYTAGVKESLEAAGRPCDALGIDISRQALIAAARRRASLSLAVGSVNALPVAEGSCDLLLNVFAPHDEAEFRRVLRPGGVLLKAVPLPEHLMELKAAVYERPYANPEPVFAPEGFAPLERREVRAGLHLPCPEDIRALFHMTPYYYKTGREDQAKLDKLEELDTTAAFCVFALRRT